METTATQGANKVLMSDSSLHPVAERVKLARVAKNLSQQTLAEMVGMRGQTGIQAIESGKSRRPSRLKELAVALEKSEDWLLGLEPIGILEQRDISAPPSVSPHPRPEPNAGPAVEATLSQGPLVPIYGQAEGGPDGKFVLNGEELARTFRPPSLVGVRYAYAVYVYGHSMEERFSPGDLVWVDPNRPVKQGDDVVVQIRPEVKGDVPFGYVKRFVSRNPQELVLKQLNPQDGADPIIRFPGASVISVHKVVFVEPG